ncbi:MAG: phage shock protein PspA [Rhodospirillales bacterium]|nr:phage shock protein PspA [Rhodospirillales bacterium]
MGIFSRFTDIMNANINSILDRAEDPEKMARLMIQEMEETLVEVRSSAVKSIADKKEIERRLEKLNQSQKEWEEKAEFAISKGREDLAKGALIAKHKLSDQAIVLESELIIVSESLQKYNDDMSKLQAKLEEAKTKRKSVEIRMKAAQKRVKIRQTLHDGRVDEALSRYDSLERRIDELEADAEAYDLGKDTVPSLEQELADLEAENGIADELAALKKKVSKKSK